ncbi:hypothetical protein ACROSR_16925 [Roseovarius tibetensis]|uniref:hypothetical protein n=1 Tax=Roseovarius tibetensis TaxID=2685897 RepID=UPI003D7F53DC
MMSKNCFVIMPFGRKQVGPKLKAYDFDKVSRIIMQAINKTQYRYLRADEEKTSNIIHSDIFRSLRDHDLVIADVSFGNPNVLYELGIRHTIRPTGTILLWYEASSIPFDVNLCRTIIYKYDGQNFDWEEGENMIATLCETIKNASDGEPDSPVHAFLEHIFPENLKSKLIADHSSQYFTHSENYEHIVAMYWKQNETEFDALIRKFGSEKFGIRAIYRLVNISSDLRSTENLKTIAKHSSDIGLVTQAVEIYNELHNTGVIDIESSIRYASAVKDYDRSVNGARKCVEMLKETERQLSTDGNGECCDNINRTLVSHRVTIQEFSLAYIHGDREAFKNISSQFETVEKEWKRIECQKHKYPVGRHAQFIFRHMLAKRFIKSLSEPPENEVFFRNIQSLEKSRATNSREESYLAWHQTFALADAGMSDKATELAQHSFSFDARQVHKSEWSDLGRRQYDLLRVFLEQYAPLMRNQGTIAKISQILASGPKS